MGYIRVYASSKKKPKKKTKAQLADEAHFAKMQAKWDRMYGPIKVKARRSVDMPDLATPPGRETPRLPSKVTAGGSTAKKVDQRYTGTKALGVALLHKSNYTPVFEDQDAKDIARMRR